MVQIPAALKETMVTPAAMVVLGVHAKPAASSRAPQHVVRAQVADPISVLRHIRCPSSRFGFVYAVMRKVSEIRC